MVCAARDEEGAAGLVHGQVQHCKDYDYYERRGDGENPFQAESGYGYQL